MQDYFYQEVILQRKPWDAEYKIIRINDQKERWVHGVGYLIVSEQNEPLILLAAVQDITDGKELEIELTAANELTASLMDSMQVGFSVVNQYGVQTKKRTGIESNASAINFFSSRGC